MHDENFIKELRGLVKKTLSYSYYRTPAVRNMYDIEDLIQDFMVRYLSPMRNGKERLSYYLEKCENKKHFENTIKQSVSQIVPLLLRNKHVKQKVMFLEDLTHSKYAVPYIDTLTDETDIIKEVETKILLETLSMEEFSLFQALLNGERRKELRKRFVEFDTLLESIREKISLEFPELISFVK